MGKVDDAHGSKGQGESDGNEIEDRADGKSIENCQEHA
jgi:hypothetical protein